MSNRIPNQPPVGLIYDPANPDTIIPKENFKVCEEADSPTAAVEAKTVSDRKDTPPAHEGSSNLSP